MNKLYIHQTSDYGLGNFINLTPTIKLMADHFGHPILVYFDVEFIRDCFTDCPFIDILDKKPDEMSYFTTALVNFKNDCPDYIHAYKQVTQRLPLGEMGHTYVDQAKEIPVRKDNYTLFIRGSGSEHMIYLNKKMPDDKYYEEYIKGKCVFTGSDGDKKRMGDLFMWRKGDKTGSDFEFVLGDVRKSLALIRDAKLIIANDSGLAHAAGAMNKNMIILWKNTLLPKNCNPGTGTIIKMCH